MKGKDLQEGDVFGSVRVNRIYRRGRNIMFTYDYLVSDDGKLRWYRQSIPPVMQVACNKVLPAPATFE